MEEYTMRAHLKIALTLLLSLVVIGCTSGNPADKPATPLIATPFTVVDLTAETVHLDFGVNVVDPLAIETPDRPFVGAWHLIRHGEDNPVSSGTIENLSDQTKDSVDNARYVDQWSGTLPPGDYEIVWGAPGYGFERTTFTLKYAQGQVALDNLVSILSPTYETIN
jgi:hypothetical protein